MTAYSQHAIANTRGTPILTEIPIKTGSQIYIGGLVNQLIGSTNRAVAATAATGRRFVGYAHSFVGPNADGLGVAAGTEKVVVAYGNEIDLAVQTSLQTNTSLLLNPFVKDDATVGGTAVGSAGVRLPIGELVNWVDETGADKTRAWVALRRFAQTNIAV